MMQWYMNWGMDGMQYEVLRIDLYDSKPDTYGHEGLYHECFKFIYRHLLNNTSYYKPHNIFMHCVEYTYQLNKQDVVDVLVNYYPEELI